MSYTFTFTTRETYLEYKADWIQRYAARSAQIRQSALAVKAANQACAQWDMSYEAFRKLSPDDRNRAHSTAIARRRAISAHQDLKKEAGQLLEERWASKEEAARQWEAQRRR